MRASPGSIDSSSGRMVLVSNLLESGSAACTTRRVIAFSVDA
jgi:hypothetical protein